MPERTSVIPRTKIVNETEVLRWFEEGRTYQWMQAEYRRKYNIETVQSMWSNFRARRGIPRRITQDDSLIPWHVKAEHRQEYPVIMLRAEARRRDGRPLTRNARGRLDSWLQDRRETNTVVHYDPDNGFSYVPRTAGDEDLIRRPVRDARKRRSRI